MDSQKQQQRKKRLFQKQNGCCFWCGKLLRPLNEKMTGKIPGDYPTFDHLDEKFDEARGLFSGEERTVLACRDCNCSRSNLRLSLEERRRRSKH